MIAIIDDDGEDIVELLAERIKSQVPSQEIRTFTSSKEAYEWAISQKEGVLELVITDYMMPEYNGLEMVGKITDAGILPTFFMLTAHDKSDLQSLPHGDKISEYFRKPQSFKQLSQFVKNYFDSKK
jgi:DNA-binding NtrC family response regulator